MSYRKTTFSLLAVLSMIISGAFSNSADAASARCHQCTQAKAASLASGMGIGRHQIFDFASGHVWSFEVEYDAEFRRYRALTTPSTPADIDLALKLRSLFVETGGTMRKFVEVSSDSLGIMGLGGANVYDVLRDRNLRIAIGDRLDSPLPASGTDGVRVVMGAFVAGGEKYAGLKGQVSMEIRVRFVDGSSMIFLLTAEKRGANYVIGSARLASGSGVIEDNTREYQGTYRVNSASELDDFLAQARSYGINVTGFGTGRYNCSFDGSNLSCVLEAT